MSRIRSVLRAVLRYTVPHITANGNLHAYSTSASRRDLGERLFNSALPNAVRTK